MPFPYAPYNSLPPAPFNGKKPLPTQMQGLGQQAMQANASNAASAAQSQSMNPFAGMAAAAQAMNMPGATGTPQPIPTGAALPSAAALGGIAENSRFAGGAQGRALGVGIRGMSGAGGAGRATQVMTQGAALADPRIAMQKAQQDLIKSYDTGLQSQLEGIGAVGAADRRRAATMAGMSGASFGGGLAGVQRQASLGQARLTSEAIAGNETKKREAMLAMLKEKLADSRRGEDQEFEREMNASGQAHDAEMARLNAQLNPVPQPPKKKKK